MSLPDPLGPLLRDEQDERQVSALWRGIQARRGRPARPRTVWLGSAALATAVGVALVLFFRPGPAPAPTPTPTPQAAAPVPAEAPPLALADGTALEQWATDREPTTVHFDEGSRVTLRPRSRISPVENQGGRLVLELAEGRARFEVVPGGPRRWVVKAASTTIEVVGTVFEVECQDPLVRVTVERGLVEVTRRAGDRVALGAGESLVVGDRLGAAAVPPPRRHATPVTPSPAAPTATLPVPAPLVIPAPSPADLGAELLEAADRARREGRRSDALEALGRALETGDAPSAALAAFTRAKIELDEPADGPAAARDLEIALSLGLPGALAEEARARRVEAHRLAGDPQAATRAAREYLARHPNGRWAKTLEDLAR